MPARATCRRIPAVKQWDRMVQLAEAEMKALFDALPAPLRVRAQALPVTFLSRPSRRLVRSGVEPDTMGLFEGDAIGVPDEDGSIWPVRVLLFLDNIWDEAEGREKEFRREVRLTLLHELGHYLGLEEDDLVERDLE